MTKAVMKDGGALPPTGVAAKGKSGNKPRASKATRWRVGVLIGVHVLAAIHIAHWMTTGSTVSPFEPSEAMEFAEKSVVNTGLVFFAITILSTLVLGRWFCGWACHVVALQDLSRALLIKLGIRPRPLKSKWMALMPIAAAFYMFVWPLLYRLYIGDSVDVRATHFISEGDEFWDTFTRSWFVGGITFFVAGFAAVYFLGAKGFCTYACPYGAVFGVVDKLSPGRIRVTDACVGCGHCTLTCTSNVDVSREVHDYGMVIDKGCMKCMDCVSVCPEHALYFGMGKPALFAKPRQEKRPPAKRLPFVEEVAGFIAFGFGYFAYRGYRQEADFLLSMGLAACFGLLVVLFVRLVRRTDVRLPGLKLKSAGRLSPVGALLGLCTVGVALLSVPFGVVPAWGMARADIAWRSLEEVIDITESTGQPARLTEKQGRTAETMLAGSLLVQKWSSVFTEVNFNRIVWGTILLKKPDVLRATVNEILDQEGLPTALKSEVAGVFQKVGLPADAEAAYRKVLADNPGFAPAISGLNQALVAMGKSPEAESVPNQGSAQLSNDLILARATSSVEAEDFAAAVTDFETVMRAEPLNVEVRNQLVSALTSSGRSEEAASVLKEGLSQSNAPEQWREQLVQILSLSADDAWTVIEAAIESSESTGQPPQLDAAQTEAAEAVLASSLGVQKWSSEFSAKHIDRIVWATILLGKPDVLRTSINEVIGKEGVAVSLKADAASVFRNVGLLADAEAAYRSVLAEDAECVPAISGLIQVLGALGKEQEAQAVLKEGLKLLPDDPNLVLARAVFSANRRDFSSAVTDLRSIIAIDPLNGVARDQLWRVLVTTGQPGIAVAVLREGLTLPDAPEEWRAHLAQVLLQAQKPEEALQEARALSHSDQGNLQMLMVAQSVFQAAGSGEEAQRVAERIAELELASSAGGNVPAPNR